MQNSACCKLALSALEESLFPSVKQKITQNNSKKYCCTAVKYYMLINILIIANVDLRDFPPRD